MNRSEAIDVFIRWESNQANFFAAHRRFQSHPLGPKRNDAQWDDYWSTFDRVSYVDPGQVEQLVKFGDLSNPGVVRIITSLAENAAAVEENIRSVQGQYDKVQQAHYIDPTSEIN